MSETVHTDPHDATVGTRFGTAKALFFAAAGLSFLASVGLFFTGQPERGIYVGLWVPSILSAGALLLQSPRHD